MERLEWMNSCRRLFTHVMRCTVWADFVFPGGGLAERALIECRRYLCQEVGSDVGEERMADFCICQAYAISRFDAAYRRRWKVSHSFGRKAVIRYLKSGMQSRYYEDRWLKANGLSRVALLGMVRCRREHPFARFIYPEYEDVTKSRLLSSEAGYAVCAFSTLLWTPFSKVCCRCAYVGKCRHRTEILYPELYRIRCQEWQQTKNK